MSTSTQPTHHEVLIIGGGAAGTTVAASLLRHEPGLDVAVIEPADIHYYQPALTLVGGGAFSMRNISRSQWSCLPEGARWIQAAAAELRPEANQVVLSDGRIIGYEYLVVCPGIKLDWGRIQGLQDTLGRNGVCSNYDPAIAPYTWKCIDSFKGGKAVFTQPATPIKCAGAPQKIAYLAAHQAHKRGLIVNSDFRFYTGGAALFSVPDFIPYLQEVARRYGIELNYGHNLIAVDGEARIARFETSDGQGGKKTIERPFDLLHVTPPQCAPDFIRNSALANADGWANVDKYSLQQVQFGNIFALGDASSLPTSKTAAAIRKQAPVVVANLLALRSGRALDARYDGYTSCPLVTAYGKVILAEFIYDAVVTPTLPLNPFKESSFYWQVKKHFLPVLYWDYMLKGYEGDILHKQR
jgi:sulfide:quinone oxidoreductase